MADAEDARRANVEAPANAHVGILVRGDVVRGFGPRAIVNAGSAILVQHDPARTVVDFDGAVHVWRVIAIEPALVLQEERRCRRSIDDRAGQVIIPVDVCRGTCTDGHTRHAVVVRIGLIGAWIGTSGDGRTNLPIGIHHPAGRVVRKVFGEIRRGAADACERSVLALESAAASTGDPAARIVFVDHAVAVVIDAVTRFGCAKRIRDTREHSHSAMNDARGTDAWLAGHAYGAAFGIAFVARAIAIVIEAIAFFRRRGNVGMAINEVVLARIRALRAHARQARATLNARARNVVVDRTVAIVVDAVAFLHRGRDVLHARGSGIDTIGFSCRTRSRFARIAIRSFAWIRFVGELIAIVVDTVAKLGYWIALHADAFDPVFALGYGDSASADAAGDRSHVVDRVITIVVDVVARFRCGQHLAHTNAPRAGEIAGLLPFDAGSFALRVHRARITGLRLAIEATAILVDLRVAVVVHAIALLGLRNARRAATTSGACLAARTGAAPLASAAKVVCIASGPGTAAGGMKRDATER